MHIMGKSVWKEVGKKVQVTKCGGFIFRLSRELPISVGSFTFTPGSTFLFNIKYIYYAQWFLYKLKLTDDVLSERKNIYRFVNMPIGLVCVFFFRKWIRKGFLTHGHIYIDKNKFFSAVWRIIISLSVFIQMLFQFELPI